MKKIMIIVLLTLLPAQSYALETDKRQHAVISVLITGAAYMLTEDITTSVLIGLGVGLGKEIYDSRQKNGDGFSRADLAADAVGIGLGVLWVKYF